MMAYPVVPPRISIAEPVRPSLDPTVPLDAEAAWAAVIARDPGFEGRLYYAVATTGIYCRPVCTARRPRRKNVEFFRTFSEARAAGYRACRKCRPDDTRDSPTIRAVERARQYLEEHAGETVTLDQLGRAVHLSPAHLQRTFKRTLGVTPHEYAAAGRTQRLRQALKEELTVGRATYEAGYGSSSRLYENSDVSLGMSPATYQKGGRGMDIRFTTIASPLGRLLVAATVKGICAVTLGDGDEELERMLRAEYPQASIQRSEEGFGTAVQAITDYLSGTSNSLDFPLDVQATAFQFRVWKALREIPHGATVSYSELASVVGAPSAARAVAGACASNRVALVIPCHRVTRGDGSLSGYRWGVERKRALLDLEKRGG